MIMGWIGEPDSIVEIISKCFAKKDLDCKFHFCESFWVLGYRVLFPSDKYISAYELKEDKYELRPNDEFSQKISIGILPVFTIEAQEVF